VENQKTIFQMELTLGDTIEVHYWQPESISYVEFTKEIIKHFLGEDWYVVDSLGCGQINKVALDEIKKHIKFVYI